MADQDVKKIRKCGNCGQEGHDKRKCPKIEKSVEVKLQTVYGILIKEDNGDSVQTWFTFYASLDGLMDGLKKTIDDFTKEHEDDDDDDVKNMASSATWLKDVLYFNESETFKNVPIPTKQYVEALLTKKSYKSEFLLIKTGDALGSCACFGCEISVFSKPLNP